MGANGESDRRVSVCSGEEISICRGLGVVSGEDLLRQGREGHFVDPGRAAGRDRIAGRLGAAGLVALKTLSVLLPSPA